MLIKLSIILIGIPKGTLIRTEQGQNSPQVSVLIKIAELWPEYAAYLLTDATETKQRNPEVELLARELKDQKKAS